MTFPVQIGPSTITINRDDRVLVCQPDGRVLGDDDGFFTRDTRFVSGYEVRINGVRPLLLSSAPIQFFSSRFEYTNDALVDTDGPIPRQSLALRLDRTVADAVNRGEAAKSPMAIAVSAPAGERSEVQAFADRGVHYLTLYAFSTENWRRPKNEVRFLMNFNRGLLHRRREELDERGENERYLPGVALPRELKVRALGGREDQFHRVDLVFLAVPSKGLAEALAHLVPEGARVGVAVNQKRGHDSLLP